MSIEEYSGKDKVNLEYLVKVIDDLVKKTSLIEKMLTDEKEGRITQNKEIIKKIENSEKEAKNINTQLSNLKTKQLSSLSKEIEDSKKALLIIKERIDEKDKQIENLEKKISEVNKLFEKFKLNLKEEKQIREEKDLEIQELKEKNSELTIRLEEKEERLKQLEDELTKLKEQLGSLKDKKDDLTSKIEKLKVEKKELNEKLKAVEKEYKEYKDNMEPVIAQNTHIRKLLDESLQGKIYLYLLEKYPKTSNIDDIAKEIDSPAVKIKSEILAMQELGVIKYNTDTREVKITEKKV
ncbi:MAG: hypothetical protein K9W46_04730 [Candidatus Heimdallarchaeum endolithica]|uniref:Chromosome partition protein Smc n=1 Tax=Candidatus Heimdallarchaeum endolithica TaxID=2876572 RepID=A0A9Y1FPH1_9ARCH|nr:MAG: hypothetical protein K9W46_04730 [Candidatus Heimdallarchaeum endolithica]